MCDNCHTCTTPKNEYDSVFDYMRPNPNGGYRNLAYAPHIKDGVKCLDYVQDNLHVDTVYPYARNPPVLGRSVFKPFPTLQRLHSYIHGLVRKHRNVVLLLIVILMVYLYKK